MLDAGQQFFLRRGVAAKSLSDDRAREVPQTLEQLAKESLGGTLIPARLHEDVEHLTALVNRTPQILRPASNPEENLIQMPAVAWARAARAQPLDVGLAELQASLANRLVAEPDAALGHHLLHITVA